MNRPDIGWQPAAANRRASTRGSTRVSILRGRALIGRHARDDVTDPSQQTARSYPHAWRHDEPEDSPPEIAVIDLPDTRDDQAEHGEAYNSGLP